VSLTLLRLDQSKRQVISSAFSPWNGNLEQGQTQSAAEVQHWTCYRKSSLTVDRPLSVLWMTSRTGHDGLSILLGAL
jgi:hypothetical protein